MKFSIVKNGQTCLLAVMCFLASACNPDEFFPVEEFLTGEDAYCYEAKDLNSCVALADRCQPAYLESDAESTDPALEKEFLVCIANPSPAPVDDGSTAGGTDDGSTSGGTDGGSTTGGTDGGATTGGTDGGSTTGGTDGGATTGGTDGGSTAGGNGNGNGGNNGGNNPGVTDPDAIPTLESALASKCKNLSSEYLWEKTETKKGKVVSKTSKVKVCHMTGSGSSHTIVIACPALRAHIDHQNNGDYIGACFQ